MFFGERDQRKKKFLLNYLINESESDFCKFENTRSKNNFAKQAILLSKQTLKSDQIVDILCYKSRNLK